MFIVLLTCCHIGFTQKDMGQKNDTPLRDEEALKNEDDEPPGRVAATQLQTDHRFFLSGNFWNDIPAYREIDEKTFSNHQFQAKQSVTSLKDLHKTLKDRLPFEIYRDIEAGLERATMSIRISPYIISLINWNNPVSDPLRRQFLPLASELLPDHPQSRMDALSERAHSPVEGLTHRYPDKALFLTVSTCPVYCRFCTRSYAVGRSTHSVSKHTLLAQNERWQRILSYVADHTELEDIVVSGGDVYNLRSEQLLSIGNALVDIPHIRRIRFATRGLSVMPMKLLSDIAWRDALLSVVSRARQQHKQVAIHTHFEHSNEITSFTEQALNILFEHGVIVRNQGVIMRRVNDNADVLKLLVKKLSYLNIQPYYFFQHDFVPGVEDLRTSLWTTLELEKQLRGWTAGFNTPTFVIDLFGGGGKRDAHSFEIYDRITGISVYRSPNTAAQKYFLYFDPIDLLPLAGQERWADIGEHAHMIDEAIEQANIKYCASKEILAPSKTLRLVPRKKRQKRG